MNTECENENKKENKLISSPVSSPTSRLKKILGNILFILIFLAVMAITFLCTSCASDTIGSPCPNYGEWCDKTPINSWTSNSGGENGAGGENP